MRPKRCTMCSNRARERSLTCSPGCAETRKWKQVSLNRHRDRSKVPGVYVVTVEDWMDILRSFNHRCAYCNRSGQKLTVDHVVPLSRGGRHCIANLVPACLNCNQKKGSLTVVEWKNYTKAKKQSARAKMSNSQNRPWTVHENLGVRPIRKRYSAKQTPIFDQVMQDQSDRIILERMGITVDYFGILR